LLPLWKEKKENNTKGPFLIREREPEKILFSIQESKQRLTKYLGKHKNKRILPIGFPTLSEKSLLLKGPGKNKGRPQHYQYRPPLLRGTEIVMKGPQFFLNIQNFIVCG